MQAGQTRITNPKFADCADPAPRLDQAGYRTLADFRYLVRRFLEFSQAAAKKAGLTPRRHQALLAVKGFAADRPPTVGDLAERLRIRPHSALELADRLVEAGLFARRQDPRDHRRVLLCLTETGEKRLAGLAAAHFEELRSLRPALYEILDRLDMRPAAPEAPAAARPDPAVQESSAARPGRRNRFR